MCGRMVFDSVCNVDLMRQFVHVCGRCDALCDVHGGTVHVLRMVRDAANVVALPDVI